MTVKELIGILNLCDHDDIVFLASDGEGNSFRQLGDYSPEIVSDIDDREITLGEPDDEGMRVVVLWPEW